MIGMQMSGFQDIYEVTENLGKPSLKTPLLTRCCFSYAVALKRFVVILSKTCAAQSSQ